MPEILSITVLLTVFAIALVIVDCHSVSKKSRDTESGTRSSGRLSDLVLFAPFLALFYTENFWTSLICTLPIIPASFFAQLACYKKSWLDSPPEVIALAPGSYLLAAAGYFVFFHEGLLTGSVPAPAPISAEVPETGFSSWISFWPYALYLSCFLFAITRKSTDGISLSTLLLILAITILPFFTGYYWWAMLAGFCMLLLTAHRAFNVMEPGTAGAFSFVSSFFYMIAAFGSVLTYAILF